MGELEIAYEIKSTLGEGPCWHNDKLYWVDIIEGIVHIHDPSNNSNQEFRVGEKIGTIAPRASGGMILALESSFAFFDDKTGTYRREGQKSNNPFN